MLCSGESSGRSKLIFTRSSRREHSFMVPRMPGWFSVVMTPAFFSTCTASAAVDMGRSSASAISPMLMLFRPNRRITSSRMGDDSAWQMVARVSGSSSPNWAIFP